MIQIQTGKAPICHATQQRFLMCLGVTVSPLDETSYQIFAPSQQAMDEAKEMIDELLSEEVQFFLMFFANFLLC